MLALCQCEAIPQPSRGRHVPCSRPPELNGDGPDLHRPARAIGQKHDLRRHLFGEPQGVRRRGPRRLETSVVAARQGSRDSVGGRLERTERRVLFRKVINPSSRAANRSFSDEAVQDDMNCLAAAQVQEIRRNEHGTTAKAMNGGKYH